MKSSVFSIHTAVYQKEFRSREKLRYLTQSCRKIHPTIYLANLWPDMFSLG